jgi:hypothetical protein
MKKIDILEAYIKFGTNCFHLTWEKKVKCKIDYGKSEEKGEFGSLWNESLGFKCGLVPQFYNEFSLLFSIYLFQFWQGNEVVHFILLPPNMHNLVSKCPTFVAFSYICFYGWSFLWTIQVQIFDNYFCSFF